MPNTPKQHKIIAEVEISCALNKISIDDGIKIYNANGLENVSKGIENYVKATQTRLLEGKPAHMKVAGTNARAMFEVLFELGNEKYIANLIFALEKEQALRERPNSKVAEVIELAKEKLLKR